VALRSALIGAGHGVHWLDVDEDRCVEDIFHGVPACRPPSACARIAQDRAQATAEQAAQADRWKDADA
jgi:hypothetical protein